MSDTITEHTLFKPRASRTEARADAISQTARAITGAETASREAKTARLRQARLDMEAIFAEAPTTGVTVKKPAPRRARSPK